MEQAREQLYVTKDLIAQLGEEEAIKYLNSKFNKLYNAVANKDGAAATAVIDSFVDEGNPEVARVIWNALLDVAKPSRLHVMFGTPKKDEF